MRISRRLEAILLSPVTLLLVVTIVIPALVLAFYSLFAWSFLSRDGSLTLENYVTVLSEPLYRRLAINTIVIALPTTIFSVLGGYFIAYYAVFVAGKGRGIVFGFVVTALMASYLVRIFAWRTMLGDEGILNTFLASFGLIDEPLTFLLFTRLSAILAEITLFLPLASLTFFSAMSGISADYREAAWDLGAGRLQTVRRVIIPLTGAAILGAATITFFLSCGDYITPTLVGGIDAVTFGVVISQAMGPIGDYGLGAALSFTLLVFFVIVYALTRYLMRYGGFLPERAA